LHRLTVATTLTKKPAGSMSGREVGMRVFGSVRVYVVGEGPKRLVGSYRSIRHAMLDLRSRLAMSALRMLDSGGILGHRDPSRDWTILTA
jgi:hypothetical protein